VSSRKQYLEFAAQYNAGGYCFGFCLKWLGSVLDRAKRSKYDNFRKEGYFPDPNDYSAITAFMERARKKQERYLQMEKTYIKETGKKPVAGDIMAKHQQRRQEESAIKMSMPGIHYRFFDFKQNPSAGITNFANTGCNLVHSRERQGVIMLYTYDRLAGGIGNHAIAIIGVEPQKSYLFDPNVGVYMITAENSIADIKNIMAMKYTNVRDISLVVISE